MTRLRILWLSHFVPYPPTSGAVQRSYQLLRRAAGRHEVTVLALNRRALISDSLGVAAATGAVRELGAEIRVFRPQADASRLRWAATVVTSYLRQAPYTVSWLKSPAFVSTARELIGSGRFDLVHVDTIALAPAVGPAPPIPVVLTHHNIESQMLDRRADRARQPWTRSYLRREATKVRALERQVCPAVAVNVVVSELDGRRLSAVAPDARWTVVENGVDIDYFNPAPPPDDPYQLVFSGTMGWYPNDDAMQFFLREIWPALCRADPRFRLTIVGRGPTKMLRDLASRDPRVTVTGEVADVRPFLREGAIYVCPIRDGGGTRLKVLEAMATGLPMIATALAMEGLAAHPGQHYLAAETAQQFVDGIVRLRDDGRLRRALGEAGRRMVEQLYSWSMAANHLEQAYQDVASIPARRSAS